MNELELKYGCNPNQKPSKVFMQDGSDLPFTVLNGKPGYINLLDALNSWQLVKELKAATGLPAALDDGTYTAKFNTDSGMFHVNEADNGCGTLTVKDKKMTIHIRLVSKKIVNLFLGSAKDAEKDGAELLQPTTDKVKYSDGTTEEVYGFDVPVEELGKEFDLAILGTKGTWYDHKVSVSDAQKK